jgi:hypothetical protein
MTATTDEFLGGGCLSVHGHDENREARTPYIRPMSVRGVTTQAEQAAVLAAVRIATNVCLNALERRPRRVLVADVPPPTL